MSSNPIAELAGVSQAAVMCLNRVGVNTVADLLKANPDEVAYLLDSYDEAERVLRAARKHAEDEAAQPDSPAAPTADAGPILETDLEASLEADLEADLEAHPETNLQAEPLPPTLLRYVATDEAETEPDQASAPAPELSGLGAALSVVATQVGETGPGLGLCERLIAVALVLEHGGSASEAIAAALHDAVLCPGWSMSPADARRRFGDQAGDLVAECARIQGVPLSPMGRPQALYVEMVARLAPAARRVCAAQALAAVRLARSLWLREGAAVWTRFHGGRDFCLWYYRALAGALAAAESTPLTRELLVAVERLAYAGGDSLNAAA